MLLLHVGVGPFLVEGVEGEGGNQEGPSGGLKFVNESA